MHTLTVEELSEEVVVLLPHEHGLDVNVQHPDVGLLLGIEGEVLVCYSQVLHPGGGEDEVAIAEDEVDEKELRVVLGGDEVGASENRLIDSFKISILIG